MVRFGRAAGCGVIVISSFILNGCFSRDVPALAADMLNAFLPVFAGFTVDETAPGDVADVVAGPVATAAAAAAATAAAAAAAATVAADDDADLFLPSEDFLATPLCAEYT